MKLAYARVSTKVQNLDMQLKAFEDSGCEKIFQEKVSGTSAVLPELDKLMEQIRPGDQVYVWAMDRIGRSVYQVIRTVAEITEKGAELIIITQDINTATSAGKILVTVFAMLAEMETEFRRQRQLAGIINARSKGITGGRKKGLTDKSVEVARRAKKLYLSENPSYSVREICRILQISSRTFYAYLDYLAVAKRGYETDRDVSVDAEIIKKLYLSENPSHSVREIAKKVNLSVKTVYVYLDYLKVPRKKQD